MWFCGIKRMNYCKEIFKRTPIPSPSRISEYGNISLLFQFVHSLYICSGCFQTVCDVTNHSGRTVSWSPIFKLSSSQLMLLASMLFVSDSAHPSLYTVKVKHSTGGTRRETGFWLERDFKHFIFQLNYSLETNIIVVLLHIYYFLVMVQTAIWLLLQNTKTMIYINNINGWEGGGVVSFTGCWTPCFIWWN